MTNIIKEAQLVLVRGFDPVKHAVEGAREECKIVPSANLHSRCEIVFANGLSGSCEFFNGAQEAAHSEVCDRRDEAQRARADDDGGPQDGAQAAGATADVDDANERGGIASATHGCDEDPVIAHAGRHRRDNTGLTSDPRVDGGHEGVIVLGSQLHIGGGNPPQLRPLVRDIRFTGGQNRAFKVALHHPLRTRKTFARQWIDSRVGQESHFVFDVPKILGHRRIDVAVVEHSNEGLRDRQRCEGNEHDRGEDSDSDRRMSESHAPIVTSREPKRDGSILVISCLPRPPSVSEKNTFYPASSEGHQISSNTGAQISSSEAPFVSFAKR